MMSAELIENSDSPSTARSAGQQWHDRTGADALSNEQDNAVDDPLPERGDFGSALAHCAVRWSQQPDETATLQAIACDAQHLLPPTDASAIVTICGPEGMKVHAESGLPWMVESALPHIHNHPDWHSGGSPRPIRLGQHGPTMASAGQLTGIGSIICTPIGWQGSVFGTLLLLSATDAFNQRRSDEAANLAIHAALAMAAFRERGHLQLAIQSRDIVGQAKGILMERDHLTADQAFARLKRSSQNANIKLREIAEAVCRTSELATPHSPAERKSRAVPRPRS